jgi:hypothetical protein
VGRDVAGRRAPAADRGRRCVQLGAHHGDDLDLAVTEADRSVLPFLIGWTIGIALVILLSTLSAEALPERFLAQPDKIPVVLEIVAGSALVGLGIFAARRRSPSPSWPP